MAYEFAPARLQILVGKDTISRSTDTIEQQRKAGFLFRQCGDPNHADCGVNIKDKNSCSELGFIINKFLRETVNDQVSDILAADLYSKLKDLSSNVLWSVLLIDNYVGSICKSNPAHNDKVWGEYFGIVKGFDDSDNIENERFSIGLGSEGMSFGYFLCYQDRRAAVVCWRDPANVSPSSTMIFQAKKLLTKLYSGRNYKKIIDNLAKSGNTVDEIIEVIMDDKLIKTIKLDYVFCVVMQQEVEGDKNVGRYQDGIEGPNKAPWYITFKNKHLLLLPIIPREEALNAEKLEKLLEQSWAEDFVGLQQRVEFQQPVETPKKDEDQSKRKNVRSLIELILTAIPAVEALRSGWNLLLKWNENFKNVTDTRSIIIATLSIILTVLAVFMLSVFSKRRFFPNRSDAEEPMGNRWYILLLLALICGTLGLITS